MPLIVSKFKAIGFMFQERMPLDYPEDYFDFKTMEWFPNDIARELKHGQLPSGLLLQVEDGPIGVVVGEYDHPQEVVLLEAK